jgi:hypothetical protein
VTSLIAEGSEYVSSLVIRVERCVCDAYLKAGLVYGCCWVIVEGSS